MKQHQVENVWKSSMKPEQYIGIVETAWADAINKKKNVYLLRERNVQKVILNWLIIENWWAYTNASS